MTDKKFTDEEIIKALSDIFYGGSCIGCRYGITKGEDRCGLKGCNIARRAINLINRLKAENERLQMGEYRHIGKTVKNARREGIEDVLDRLRNIISLHTENHISLGLKDIDLIESEMVGEDNAT